MQYIPIINGLDSWQIYAGPNETGAVDLPVNEWVHVKIVVKNDKADIYVGDTKTPSIHIPDLYNAEAAGPISVYAGDRPGITSGAYFSNIAVRPLTDEDKITGEAKEETPPPEGVITEWSVSAPFAEADIKDSTTLAASNLKNYSWTKLNTERSGIANLARVTQRTREANTALVRKTVLATEDTKTLLSFGYSDRVILFVNGKRVFSGNAGWRVRDHRFLGTVGFNDAILLPLKKGENEIVAAVSENFGGWAFAGAVANREGLSLP